MRRVERRGKHQLFHLTDGRVLHAHFRMTGDWHIDRADDELPRFARAVISFTDITADEAARRGVGTQALARFGARSYVVVALRKDDRLVGTISV